MHSPPPKIPLCPPLPKGELTPEISNCGRKSGSHLGFALGRWLCAGLLAGSLSSRVCAAEEQGGDAAHRLQLACGFFSGHPQGRQADLELFVLATAWAAQGLSQRAAGYQEYLRTYYPRSPLLPLLGPPDPDAGFLETFEPDPDFSRLIKAGCQLSVSGTSRTAEDTGGWLALVRAYQDGPENLPAASELEDFLQQQPEAPLAGWAAYQLLWEQRLLLPPAAGCAAVARFASAHRGHPLAQEAAESLDLQWFSPRDMALRSILLPGWGEETLEPGLRASSGALYSEALYALGLIGFSVASRQANYLSNLTGALIFANLLMLNHVSSANNAFQLARHRNWANRRAFIAGRLEQPVPGAGHFEAAEFEPLPEEPLARELVLSLIYRPLGLGEALRGQHLVDEQQLANAGIQAEYLASLAGLVRVEGLAVDWAIAPSAWLFAAHASASPDSDFTGGADIREWAAALQTGLLARLDLGGSWIQARLSLGPAFRQRSLSALGQDYSDQGPAGEGAFALAFGGESGCYWQAGVTCDQSASANEFTLAGQRLTAPAFGLSYQFSLAMKF